jgi:hypothetical protein
MVYLLISSEDQLSENEMSEDNVSIGEVSDNKTNVDGMSIKICKQDVQRQNV